MKRINWREPVETEDGIKLIVVKPGLVKGLPSNPKVGRKPGPEMTWRYLPSGKSSNGFLPNIRNVGD